MYHVIGPIKQTKKQKAYCKELGIDEINEIKMGIPYFCSHCGQILYEGNEVILRMRPQSPNP